MDCRTARALMAAALDGGPPPLSNDGLEMHFGSCAVCRSEWARVKMVDGLLHRRSMADPPEAFVESTMKRVATGTHRSVSAPDLSAADAGLVLAAAVVISLIVSAWVRQFGLGAVDPHAVAEGVQLLLKAAPAAPTGLDKLALEIAIAALVAALWSGAILVPRRPLTLPLRN